MDFSEQQVRDFGVALEESELVDLELDTKRRLVAARRRGGAR